MNGWIKLHRGFLEWEWKSDPKMVALFIHCLLKANSEDKNWRGEKIKRGTFITSLSKLAYETGLSIKELRVRLKNLQKTGEIGQEKGTQFTHISISNYDSYQVKEKNKGTEKARQGHTEGTPRATTKELKELKEDNNNTPEQAQVPFEEKYRAFIEMFNHFAKRSFKGDAKSKRQLKARIKEGYTSGDFKKAIENAMKSEYHKESNFKHLTPEFITRSDKLEKWANVPTGEVRDHNGETILERRMRLARQ